MTLCLLYGAEHVAGSQDFFNEVISQSVYNNKHLRGPIILNV